MVRYYPLSAVTVMHVVAFVDDPQADRIREALSVGDDLTRVSTLEDLHVQVTRQHRCAAVIQPSLLRREAPLATDCVAVRRLRRIHSFFMSRLTTYGGPYRSSPHRLLIS